MVARNPQEVDEPEFANLGFVISNNTCRWEFINPLELLFYEIPNFLIIPVM